MNPFPFSPIRSFRHRISRRRLLTSLAASCVLSSISWAAEPAPVSAEPATPAETDGEAPATRLDPLVITGTPPGDRPLEVRIDPQAAAQPIPAQDGADILKTVPGVSVSRKGGTGGEVILRGAAGSRLDILVDNESLLGGCPSRMDPPTAYIFPGAYDRVTVLKGPQTVLYGPGNSAGVVLFESDPPRLAAPTASLDAALTFGSFNRNDQLAGVLAGTPDFYARVEAVRSESDDYEDGNGDKVHSHYQRSTVRAALGWTPDKNTVIELHGAFSQGEAAYAHSMMDASELDRQNVGLRFERREVSPLVESIEASFYYNHIDHVMDNYSLRAFTPTPMMPMPMSSNPEYTLWGGRGLAALAPAENTLIKLGGDFRLGEHRANSVDDARIDTYGLFAELTQTFARSRRVIAGLRFDAWSAEDKRSASASATGGEDRDETLPSGFVRYEQDLAAIPATVYAGIGYTQRAPDYWEMFSYQSAASTSSFDVDLEKTLQLDVGATWKQGPLSAFVSGFANDVSDYILIEKTGSGMMSKTIARNIEARSLGGEAGVGYALGDGWRIDASIACVRGRNRTDGLPLAQQPPLEGRIGVSYATSVWSLGALARLVDAQDRYAVNQGSVAGQDIGATGGFAVFSINGGWRLSSHALLTAGIDNLFDKTYAEHVNRAGNGDPAYVSNVRVNEPGRTLWMKLQVTF